MGTFSQDVDVFVAPLSVADQLQQLQEWGLHIDNPTEAERCLQRTDWMTFLDYSCIFIEGGKTRYFYEICFEDIVEIIDFDADLRSLLLKYLFRFERFFRSLMVNIFGSHCCSMPPYNQHYHRESYSSYRTPNFDAAAEAVEILTKASQNKKTKSIEFLPLSELILRLTFGELSRLFRDLRWEDQNAVAMAAGLRGKESGKPLAKQLHALTLLRNQCAHHERLYSKPPKKPVFVHPEVEKMLRIVDGKDWFRHMIVILDRLPTKQARDEFMQELSELIDGAVEDGRIMVSCLGMPSNYREFLDKCSKLFPPALS